MTQPPESAMSDDGAPAAGETPRENLMAHLRQLETFMETSKASGEEIPAEAMEMLSRLREIVLALDGLADAIGDRTPPTA
jgi:hypothetical protein